MILPQFSVSQPSFCLRDIKKLMFILKTRIWMGPEESWLIWKWGRLEFWMAFGGCGYNLLNLRIKKCQVLWEFLGVWVWHDLKEIVHAASALSWCPCYGQLQVFCITMSMWGRPNIYWFPQTHCLQCEKQTCNNYNAGKNSPIVHTNQIIYVIYIIHIYISIALVAGGYFLVIFNPGKSFFFSPGGGWTPDLLRRGSTDRGTDGTAPTCCAASRSCTGTSGARTARTARTARLQTEALSRGLWYAFDRLRYGCFSMPWALHLSQVSQAWLEQVDLTALGVMPFHPFLNQIEGKGSTALSRLHPIAWGEFETCVP